MMSRRFGQGRAVVLLTGVCVAAGVSPTSATAGHHHNQGTTYDVVQGYIIQGQPVSGQCAAAAAPGCAPVAAPTAASPQSQAVTVAAPQAPAPQLAVAPAPAPVAVQVTPVTYVPMVQVAAAPAPTQMVQVAAAPAPTQMVQVAAAPAPTQMVSLAATTQVQYVTVQAAAPTQMVTLTAPQPQVAAKLTPVQVLIPHQKKCHHHFFCSCK